MPSSTLSVKTKKVLLSAEFGARYSASLKEPPERKNRVQTLFSRTPLQKFDILMFPHFSLLPVPSVLWRFLPRYCYGCHFFFFEISQALQLALFYISLNTTIGSLLRRAIPRHFSALRFPPQHLSSFKP